jgi:hypothetical protein
MRFFRFIQCSIILAGVGSAYGQARPVIMEASALEALTTIEVRLDLAPSGQVLSFDFGFGSNEGLGGDGFLDALSVTLQSADRSATALLLTLDVGGLTLAPTNPGGLSLSREAFQLTEITEPSLLAGFGYRVGYHVSVALPSMGVANSLFFDFFSNQNAIGSQAFFRDVQLAPPPFAVESASVLNGVFTSEPEAYLDFTAWTAEIPKIRRAQFFRVQGDLPVKLALRRVAAGGLEFDFEFRPKRLELWSAATESGPFAKVEGSFDLAAQAVKTTPAEGPRVYRIESDVPVIVESVSAEGAGILIRYRFEAGALTLQSSQIVGGPYVDSADAVFDLGARTIRAPRMASRQVFRLNGVASHRLKRVEDRGEAWRLWIE